MTERRRPDPSFGTLLRASMLVCAAALVASGLAWLVARAWASWTAR